MSKLFYKLTGGRPMRAQELAFVDQVTRKPVYRFVGGLGRKWLAEHRGALFRIEESNL